VGIVVDKDLKEKIVGVKRLGDRIIAIKLVVGEEIIYIILAYAPQTGLVESVKSQFWEEMGGLLHEIPTSEKIFLGGDLNWHGGDLNWHVGTDNRGYGSVHGGQGFREKNELGDTILDFALAFDLVIAITALKREDHLITYKSGIGRSQIDFFCS